MNFALGLAQIGAVLAVFWLPGGIVLWSLGLSGRLRLAALAPAVTTGLFAAFAMVASAAGVRWNLLVATVCVAIVVGVVLALRRRLSWGDAMVSTARWRAAIRANRGLLAVLVLVVVVQLAVLSVPLFVPDRLPDTWDSTFHFNALQYVRLVGVADPVTFGSLADALGSAQFYPAGWHAVAGLVPVWLGTTTVFAAATYVPIVVAWAVGLAALAREIVPRSYRPAPAVAAAMAMSGLATPLWIADLQGIIPNAMAIAFIPGAAAGVVAVVRGQQGHGGRRTTILALLVACFGIGACHPGAFVGLLLVVLPWCGTAARRWWSSAPSARRWAASAFAALAVAALITFLARDGLVRTVREADNEGGAVRLGDALSALLTGRTSQAVSYAIVPVVLALWGIALRIRAREDLRPVASWVLIAVTYVLAVTKSTWSAEFTGLFYGEGRRIAPLLAVWTSVLAAEALVRSCQAVARRIEVPARLGAPGSVRLVAAVVVTVVSVWPVVLLRGATNSTYSMESPANPAGYFSVEELAMAHRLPNELPQGSRLLGSGLSGVSHLYGLVGLDVLPFYIQPTLDLQRVVTHFADLESDPTICATLRAHGVTDIYVDTTLSGGRTYPYDIVAFASLPSSGLKLVDRGGTASVYQITGC